MEEGEFMHNYPFDLIKEQDNHIIVEGKVTRDIHYIQLKLLLESHFDLVDLAFQNMHYEYISWLEQPSYSIHPTKLKKRFRLYESYGNEDRRRIKKLKQFNEK